MGTVGKEIGTQLASLGLRKDLGSSERKDSAGDLYNKDSQSGKFGPAASTSTWNFLKCIFSGPIPRSIESETQSGAQLSVLEQALQVILMYTKERAPWVTLNF